MKRKNIVDNILMQMQLHSEALPHLPLIEIVGNRRALVENHVGVCCYSHSEIVVKIRQGTVKFSGEGLELREISKEQLVIVGKISNVVLLDGG